MVCVEQVYIVYGLLVFPAPFTCTKFTLRQQIQLSSCLSSLWHSCWLLVCGTAVVLGSGALTLQGWDTRGLK